MTKFLTGLQILAAMLQGAPEVINVIQPRYHPLLHFSLGALSVLAHWAQQGYGPNGIKIPPEAK